MPSGAGDAPRPQALAVLAALVAGSAPPVALGADPAAWDAVLRAGRFHGVLPWIHGTWPAEALRAATAPAFAEVCAAEARRAAAADLAQRQAIGELLPRIAAAGGEPLLLKGSALACGVYPAPAMRPRADIDVLIQPAARAAVERALAGAGFEPALRLPGARVFSQASWTLRGPGAPSLDLHWRVSNSPVLARLLDHAELSAAAVAVPALGPHARAPDAGHALLIAALHRAGSRDAPYHGAGWSLKGGDRLIWLLDFVLLARTLDADARVRVGRLFREKAAQALLEDATRAVRGALPGLAPGLDDLVTGPDPTAAGPTARYVRAGPLGRRWADFHAVGAWPERLRLLGELLLPPADYLRRRDPARAHWPRALLIVRRLLRLRHH